MIGLADITKAVVALWDAQPSLDVPFMVFWPSEDINDYPVLNDGEATPGTPFPYCVFELNEGTITNRMSGTTAAINRAVRDVPLTFKVWAAQLDDQARTAKEIAADMAEEIMKRFGGHPEMAPGTLTLDHGGHLITRYNGDFGVRVGDTEHQWVVNYTVRVDVPIA